MNALDLTADVLVIGGGPAATWAALKADETGADVVLTDKGYCGTSGGTASAGTGVWADIWLIAGGWPGCSMKPTSVSTSWPRPAIRSPALLVAEATVRGTGGIRITADDCATTVPGLYAAGDAAARELICGGFTGGGSHNAAWAMSSGSWAGVGAARFARTVGKGVRQRALSVGRHLGVGVHLAARKRRGNGPRQLDVHRGPGSDRKPWYGEAKRLPGAGSSPAPPAVSTSCGPGQDPSRRLRRWRRDRARLRATVHRL